MTTVENEKAKTERENLFYAKGFIHAVGFLALGMLLVGIGNSTAKGEIFVSIIYIMLFPTVMYIMGKANNKLNQELKKNE